jgi:gamma-glutamylcyclotransferase (GGCT)/AIG2-like uncharacterized protein YtfP
MSRLLFFYGTLMSGDVRESVPERAGLRRVGPGRIRGDLYSVHDGFPAFVTGDGVIVGEVWEAPSDAILRGALHVTDAIEGYHEKRPEDSMYLRETHPLLDDPDGRVVQVYRWNRPVAGRDRSLRLATWPDDEFDEDEPDGIVEVGGETFLVDWKTEADRH